MEDNSDATTSSPRNDEDDDEVMVSQPLPASRPTERHRNFLRLLPIQQSIHPDEPMHEVNGEEADDEFEDAESRDRLFEEYIREIDQIPPIEQRENFNTELPTEHLYMGNMDRVSGINYYEVGKVYKLPISGHDSIIFPGETLPMIMAEHIFDTSSTPADGLTFGLICSEHATKNKVFGVTCQVYEQGVDSLGNITIKSRAHQRFLIVKHQDGSYMRPNLRRGFYADVRILPEIVLPDPLLNISSSSTLKLSRNQSQYEKLRTFVASSTVWPKFVYDQYETESVRQKVDRFLENFKIETVPADPVLLSFWLARNIPITNDVRKEIFTTDSVTTRMIIIGKALDSLYYFCCRRCKTKVANSEEIFAMSKQGVQTSYCNPSGFIHETLTVYNTIENSTDLLGRPSAEFSWFPGYAWQIAQCSCCYCHLGWKFIAMKKNLMPRSFFGLSGKSITAENMSDKNPLTIQSPEAESDQSLSEDSD